ncbi:hypothetical protein SDC9_139880 [bioreactor metagenome]|uniref:Uncharacterized protein n=1 Tax=bioreactor metagenome TaxID=1076179 RepID=A0A645DTC3_9ZZZZ
MQTPIGVRLKKFAVARNHLRLEPEAEFEAEFVDLLHQLAEPALEFRLIDEPVAEAGVVVVAVAEPAVVEHQHFDAQLRGVFRDGQQFLRVEMEVGRLPVVDQDRPLAVFPRAADQLVAEYVVEGAAHGSKPFCRVDQQRFGSLELFAGTEFPGESPLIDADLGAQPVELVKLDLGGEVAAVKQGDAVDLSGLLGGVRRGQREERVLLVAGKPAHRFDHRAGVGKRRAFDAPLPRPGAGKVDEFKISARKVKHGAGEFFQPHALLRVVDRPRRAGNGVVLSEYAVRKQEFDVARLVVEREFEGFDFALFAEGGRQSG